MQPMTPRLIPRLKQTAITPAHPAQRRTPTTPHLHPRRAVPPTKNRNASCSTQRIFRITLGDNMKLRALIATSTLFVVLVVFLVVCVFVVFFVVVLVFFVFLFVV